MRWIARLWLIAGCIAFAIEARWLHRQLRPYRHSSV